MPQPGGPIDTRWLLEKAKNAIASGVSPDKVKAAARSLFEKASGGAKQAVSETLPTGDLKADPVPSTAAAGQNVTNQQGGNSNRNNLLALARSRGISTKAALAWGKQYQKNQASHASTSSKIAYVNSLSPQQKKNAQPYVTSVTEAIAEARAPKAAPVYSGVGDGGGGGGIGGPLFEKPPMDTMQLLILAAAGLGVAALAWRS